MRKTKLWMALAVAVFASALLTPAFAQDTGKIHGHVQDPAGVAVTDGIITLSTDGGKTAKRAEVRGSRRCAPSRTKTDIGPPHPNPTPTLSPRGEREPHCAAFEVHLLRAKSQQLILRLSLFDARRRGPGGCKHGRSEFWV